MKRFKWTKGTVLAGVLAGFGAACSPHHDGDEHAKCGHECGHEDNALSGHAGCSHETGPDANVDEHTHAGCDHACGEGQKASPEQNEASHKQAHDAEDDHEQEPAGHAHDEGCAHAHDAAADAGCPSELAAFEVSESAQRLLGLTLTTAAERPVTGTVRFSGRFEWMPGARRVYSAAVSGAVTVRVRPPQKVMPGEVLFSVRSPEWVRQTGELREAEAEAGLLRQTCEVLRDRIARLQAAGTRQAELEMTLALKAAEAQRAVQAVQSAQSRREAVLAFCREQDGELVFVAREAGFVETRAVDTGAWVEPGAGVVTVTQADGLWFRADGVVAEMPRVRAGQTGFVEPLGAARDGNESGTPLTGVIEIGLSADAADRIQPVYLTLRTLPAWAAPGRVGVLSVVTETTPKTTVAVPVACVVADGLKPIVFVRDEKDPDRFIKREVVTGASDGDWVAVTGVRAGEKVVLAGAYELKLAAPSAGAPKKTAGHFHADGQFHEGKH